MRSLPCALCTALIVLHGCAQRESAFEALMVPTQSLPDDCELAPKGGLPFGPPNLNNPVTTTDPAEIGMLSMFVLESDQAAEINAAYVAEYNDKSGKENFVWALLFKDPQLAKSHFERLSQKYESAEFRYYDVKDSILINAWTDNLDDHSCFDGIQGHLEKN